jgi:hypothetical protein
MRFTERDGRLLHWINGHGFVTLRQVARWLGTNYQTAQRRIWLLYDHGYLDRQWLVHGDRAHWLTPAGRAMCGDSLPPPKHIRLASYRLKAAVGQLTAPELNLPVDVYDADAHYQAVRNRLFGLGR